MGDLPKIDSSGSAFLTIKIPIKQVFEKSIMFKMNLKKDPACVNQKILTPIEAKIEQNFDYQISVKKPQKEERPTVLRKSQDYSFVHNYELQNDGPSPSNQIYEFSLYLPKIIVKDSSKVEKLFDFIPDRNPNISCSKKEDGNSLTIPQIKSKKGFEPISCTGYDCIVYQCKIHERWAKGDSKSVRIKMELQSGLFVGTKSELQKFDHFSVWTAISFKAASSDKDYLAESTDFISNRSGNWQAKIVEYWPIAVGLFIGIVVLASVVYALFKAGALRKLRFFHMDDDM